MNFPHFSRATLTIPRKTALITGATDGLGYHTALALAREGYHVLAHGRNAERAEALIRTIRLQGGHAAFYSADFSSLAEVRSLAAQVAARHQRLDLLINNAGIGTGGPNGQRALSRDGYELRWTVNYLSGFLLTRLLLPLISASGAGRIIHVASAGQHAIDFDDVMLNQGYSGDRAYGQSKLAQIMDGIELARGRRDISVNSLHPASYMDTAMVRNDGIRPWNTVETGVRAVMHLACSAQVAGTTGAYFDGMAPSSAHRQASDARARTRLLDLSRALAGID